MKKILLFAITLLVSTAAFAEDDPAPIDATPQKSLPATRPKVGIVLSGGGAKGMAHIGVLKALEELEIPVDYIVGTSIGSIIGGIYALGYSAAQMDSLVHSQDWELLMKDKINRRQLSYEDKKTKEKCVVTIPFLTPKTFGDEMQEYRQEDSDEMGPFPATPKKKGVLNEIPMALVEGQNLHQLFTKLSVGYQDSIDFNTLPIPFACVAVDVNTKEEVVFHGGDIVNAIRSSMSIPAYFVPIKDGRKTLVDGGMLNNFPVDVVREMGADIVIGVDLHYHKKMVQEDVETIPEMVNSMLSIMNGEKYYEGRKNADILICPDTKDFGILAFDEESITALEGRGYSAAQEEIKSLKDLSDLMKRYPKKCSLNAPKAINLEQDSVFISQVSITGANPKEMSWLLDRTDIKPGEYLDGSELDKSIEMFYNTRAFKKVTYSVAGKDNNYNLKVRFTPERLHQFGIGFRFDSEEKAAILASFSFNRHKIFGNKFDVDLELAQNSSAVLKYGYTFKNLLQFNASATFRNILADLYDYGVRTSSTKVNYFRGDINFEIKKYLNTDIKVGACYDNYKFVSALEFYDDYVYEDMPEIKGYAANVYARYDFDNFTDPYFPHRGMRMEVMGSWYPDLYKDDVSRNVYGLNLNWQLVIPFGSRFAAIPQLYNRWMLGNLGESVYKNYFGGYMKGRYLETQLPFVGTNHCNTAYDCVDIARLDLRLNHYKNHYITLMANYMLDFQQFDELFSTDEFAARRQSFGAALSYSVDTFIGPVQLIGHWSNLSKFGMYFQLGYNF